MPLNYNGKKRLLHQMLSLNLARFMPTKSFWYSAKTQVRGLGRQRIGNSMVIQDELKWQFSYM